MKKFINFKLSIGGKDVPSDIKGAEIGLWIKNKERENFLSESLPSKVTDKFKPVELDPKQSEAEKDFNKHHSTSAYAERGSIAEPDTIDFDFFIGDFDLAFFIASCSALFLSLKNLFNRFM